ncbi:MAG: DUF1295 domain-containing protein [Candidatus Lokiarchaeota archaeon]|nr:DUF1295 domain-containing protein [Candidatus Lokiarchaeota archaeon]
MVLSFWLAYLFTFLIILALFGGLYLYAYLKKRYNSVNIAYGIGFPVAAILIGIFRGNLFIGQKLIATFLILVTGVRLAVIHFLRNYGKDEETGETRRFKEYRDHFGKSASWKGFLFLYLPQAIAVMIIGFPVYAINYTVSSGWQGDGLFYLIGGIIWVGGFSLELVADLQMWKFKINPTNQGKILRTGLWKYSMHPNYFGQIVQWCGFFVLGLITPSPYEVIGLISPIAIWVSLMFLSGIPLLDKRFQENVDYQQYRRETNRLIPWFKKSSLSRKD